MAHEDCLGGWENSKRGGVLEGNGRFDIESPGGDVITGTHQGHGNSPMVGTCNGTTIKFCMFNETTGEVICYKGKITPGTGGKLFINGKFKKPLEGEDVDSTDTEVIEEGKRVLLAADDWTAEKPGTD